MTQSLPIASRRLVEKDTHKSDLKDETAAEIEKNTDGCPETTQAQLRAYMNWRVMLLSGFHTQRPVPKETGTYFL